MVKVNSKLSFFSLIILSVVVCYSYTVPHQTQPLPLFQVEALYMSKVSDVCVTRPSGQNTAVEALVRPAFLVSVIRPHCFQWLVFEGSKDFSVYMTRYWLFHQFWNLRNAIIFLLCGKSAFAQCCPRHPHL